MTGAAADAVRERTRPSFEELDADIPGAERACRVGYLTAGPVPSR